jgi:hypothetical protein
MSNPKPGRSLADAVDLAAGAPALSVEELDLHAGPEGLDDRVDAEV